ncbi:C10 family peptidase [Trichlorobacter lovleyi]|nr:C10 family peptidase [Trichlorobacter lovleyi]
MSTKTIYGISLVLILGILVCPLNVIAAPVAEVVVRRVAQNFLRHQVERFGLWANDPKPVVTKIQLVEHEGEPIAYNVSVKPSGYLLIPYHDEFTPVVLFSYRSSFEPSRVTQPDSVESWILPEMFSTHKSIQKLKEQVGANKSIASEKTPVGVSWQFYAAEPATPEATTSKAASSIVYATAQVAPLLTTTWGQSPYYNYLTPAGTGDVGTCAHTLTGCVATAWSQILRYWRWPDKGVGSNSYAWNGTTLSADFSQSVYDWNNMPSALSSFSTSTQINAVAKLMSDVGIAVYMDYGCSDSGAGVTPYTLPTYFNYKPTQAKHIRNDYTSSTWFDLFKNEFDAVPGRPVMFSSVNSTIGAHAFVADGYQTDGITSKVHLNLGWDGWYDAYYDVYNGFTTGSYFWSGSNQSIITGIVPNDPKDFSLSVSKTGAGTGTVTASDGGLFAWNGTTGTNGYATGDVVTLTATADNGSTFTGWSGGGCTGTGPCTVTMLSDTSITATFTSVVALSEAFESSSVPTGWTRISDPAGTWWFGTSLGTNYTGGTGGFARGSNYGDQPDAFIDIELRTPALDLRNYGSVNLAFKSVLNASTADVDISENGPAGPWVNILKKTQGSFTESISLNMTSVAAGKSNVMVRFHYYGTMGSWRIDDVLINGLPLPPVLSVSVAGTGGGTVTSDPLGTKPVGITCTSGTCTTTFPYGQNVTLLQMSDSLSTFGGWGGACLGLDACTVAMDSAKGVTATFTLAPKAKIGSNGYGSLADAYAAASTTDTTLVYLLEDTLSLSTVINKKLNLQGGYKADFSRTTSGVTTLQGVLTIGTGSVTADRIVVK